MLIPCDRHTRRDLEVWARLERADRIHARLEALEKKTVQAREVLERFAAAAACYVSVSWGKDSTVVAHLAVGLDLPLVAFRWPPAMNPYDSLVREAFLSRFPAERYEEIVRPCHRGEDGLWHTGSIDEVARRAERKFGRRHVLGLRAGESSMRKRRMARWGLSSPYSCCPIGHWSAADVFGYLARHDLPVHPAYACSGGGAFERARIRVDVLGGEPGAELGRRAWEWMYFRPELEAMGEAPAW